MSDKKRYFQWLDGDDRGKVVTLKNIYEEEGEEFFEFDDGEVCSREFVSPMFNSVGEMRESRKNKDGKYIPAFVIEVDSPSNVWSWEEVRAHGVDLGGGRTEVAPSLEDINALGSQRDGEIQSTEGKLKLVAPKVQVKNPKELPTLSQYKDVRSERDLVRSVERSSSNEVKEEDNTLCENPYQAEERRNEKISVKTSASDPVSILVSTSKKYEKEVNITLNMMLPTKELFNIVKTNFDDGVEKFLDNVVRDLDVSKIVEAIRYSLECAYNGYSDDKEKEPECVGTYTEPDRILKFDEEGNVID